jgi:coenzyme PQQ biosynthesis protein PqqD
VSDAETKQEQASLHRASDTGDRQILALARHAALKHRHHGEVLVLPEQAIRLRGSGAEILRLCDGQRDRAAILATLEARYPGTEGLAEELDRFLGEMVAMGGLEPAAPPGEEA